MKNSFTFPNINDNEIIIRKGAASPVIEPVKLEIEGDINAVKSFLELRRGLTEASSFQAIDPAAAIIVADKQNLFITLYCDPVHPFGAVITSRLEIAPELLPFQINKNTFSREAFIKLIRFNKIYFENAGQHEKLLTQLISFAADTSTQLQQNSDARGNKNNSFKKAVYTDILSDVILIMPVYKNDSPVRFRAEICFDVTETAAKFWFESIELAEALIKRRDELFSEQLKACNGLVIIHK